MDIEEIAMKADNWVDSAQDRDYLESPCECGIETPGSISHELVFVLTGNDYILMFNDSRF